MQVAWILFGLASAIAGFFAFQWNAARQASLPGHAKLPAGNAPPDLEKKIDGLKAELSSAKDEIQKKQKLLEEAREEAKKKLRREGKKAEREEEQKAAGVDPRDLEIQGLKKGLASLESQLNAAKSDVTLRSAELERIVGETGAETQRAARGRDEDRNRNKSLADENAALKRTLEELRMSKKKDSERPEVPGTSLDLKALPPEAVQELARYFRKGEEFERLYAVAQGQLQLAQDRYMEVQRRYFAVCRELALVAGQKPTTDAEAKQIAEGVVTGTDQVARQNAQGGQPGQAQVAGAPGATGEGQKKRRRRRRKRKPGAPGEAGVVTAADAAGDEGSEGTDDGDDGDDGDEGSEPGTPPETNSGAAPAPASA